MLITASGMRDRCSVWGIAQALEEKYIGEIQDALQAVWETPSDTNYVAKRVYNVGLPETRFDTSVSKIMNYFNQLGYETRYTQGNLLTVSW